MGTETVSGIAFCAGWDGRCPKHPGYHLPGSWPTGCHPALQLQVPDQMYFLGTGATNRDILLPVLVKVYAKTEPLPEKGSPRHLGVWKTKNPARKYWKRYRPPKCIWQCPVSQWEYCKAFPSVSLERSVPEKYTIREHLPEKGYRKRLSCTICVQAQQNKSGTYWLLNQHKRLTLK